jgi:hypothetical protein
VNAVKHSRLLKCSQKLEGLWRVVVLLTQLGDNTLSKPVHEIHLANLLFSFRDICLVDTEDINPEHFTLVVYQWLP